jgi:elongation factor Ts
MEVIWMSADQVFGIKDLTAEMIKAVRKETRAGTIDCRDALIESRGDVKKAIEILKEKGIETPRKVYV